MSCPNCEAVLPDDLEQCPSCDLVLNAAALQLAAAASSASGRIQFLKNLAGAAAAVALVTGLGIGVAVSPARHVQVSVAERAAENRRDVTQLQRELLADWNLAHEVFRLSVESSIRLGLTGWEERDGYVLFLLAPPSANRSTVWETLSHEQRRQVMEMLGIEYTAHLMRVGQVPRLQDGAHPPFGLIYEGETRPLAVRDRNGDIRIAPR